METFAGFFLIIGGIMFAVFYVMLYLPIVFVLWVIRRARQWWKVRAVQQMLMQPEFQKDLEEGITDGMVKELKRVGLDPANFNLNRPGVDFVPPPTWRKKARRVLRWALVITGLPIAYGFIKAMLS